MVNAQSSDRPMRRVSWGDTPFDGEELVDQFVLHLEHGEDLSSPKRRKRWMALHVTYPYSKQVLVLEDYYRTNRKKTTHCVRMMVRVTLVNGYPLAHWYVLAIADREHDSRTAIQQVSAPDYDGLCRIVQDWVLAEYGTDEGWDCEAWMPTVG